MKHIVLTVIGMSENQIRAEKKQTESGTHEFLINKVLIQLRNKGGDWRTFQADIGDAKILRVKSDYKDEEILDKDSDDSLQLATKNNQILKSVFNL
ncbi:hypothetical protein [Mucilaginibacter sp. UR6-11]|uniref:hypothetical protein n=1 Tax=Mucilaginibacter sp. UR6-11 TaxID=1435644 RepID=UPI001E5ABC6D|nr:hypothetical protein [Mucilaginibacter sp. UR6-11]MCC8426950.1 hypothetical protein [Mucilaginibacter sp. UR6-11]